MHHSSRQRFGIRACGIAGLGIMMSLWTGTAQAVPFGPKSSREVMPAREVERPLDMPRGWSEFTFGHSAKFGNGKWTADGQSESFEHAKWTWHTTLVRWRYGMTRRSDIQWDLPFHYGVLVNDELGTNLRSGNLGDIRLTYRYRLYEAEEAPMTAVVVESSIKGPTGRETPGTYRGGPDQMSTIITSSGSWDVYLGAAARRQVGPSRFTARLGYMRRFSGLTQFVVETDNDQFAGRFKPGDRLQASIEAMAQVGPVALGVAPSFAYRAATKAGVTSSNWINPGSSLVAYEGSDGVEVDLGVTLLVNVTRGFDFMVNANLPLMGEDLQFFPLEDVHPTFGPTFGAAAEVRF